MTTDEIQAALRRYWERLEAILAPEDLARYDAYLRRVQGSLARQDPALVVPTPAEQATLDQIAADQQAAALNRQFLALIGVERLPQ